MITKVRLKNWRSHSDSEFNFSTGTNALVGILGSGKTSVLDSICFALFGTFPTLQSKKLKLDDIIMSKPVQKDRTEIEVGFQLNGSSYSVKRVIERGKGTTFSELRENGKLLESPSTQRVTELVEKALKVNYELFSKAIYSEQNALDYFLTLGRGQRMRKIDELLMIDKFEQARASAVTLTNKIVERKLGKQSVVERADANELEKGMTELRSSLSKIVEEKENLKESLGDIASRKIKLESEVAELQKIKENLELLKREEKGVSSVLDETKAAIESLEKTLKSFDRDSVKMSLLEFSKKIEELESSLKGKLSEYEDLQERMTKSKANIEFLRKEKIDKLEKELEEKLKIKKEFEHLRDLIGENVDEQLNEKKALLENLIGEVEGLKVKIKDLQEILDKLSSVEGICPICESKLTEEKKAMLIAQKQEQLKALKEKLEAAKQREQLSKEELRKLEEAAGKLGEMLTEIRDFNALKSELENSKQLFLKQSESAVELGNQLSAIRNELESVQSELKESTDEKQKLEILSTQLESYEERKSRLSELIKQRDELKRHVEEVKKKIAGRELGKLESWLKNLIAKERETETRISSFDELMLEKELRIKEYEQSLAALEREKNEIKKLDMLIKELKIFTQALKQTQIELRREFVESVNFTMGKLWPSLYPYRDFVSAQLAIQEDDYVLRLQRRDGNWVNVEGMASGGERSIACLAMRIAFALVLAPQLRVLILDEPTANLDAQSIKVLATTLREGIQEFIDQCFLISHQSELEDAVTGSLYRLERDKERDEVTKVISI